MNIDLDISPQIIHIYIYNIHILYTHSIPPRLYPKQHQIMSMVKVLAQQHHGFDTSEVTMLRSRPS